VSLFCCVLDQWSHGLYSPCVSSIRYSHKEGVEARSSSTLQWSYRANIGQAYDARRLSKSIRSRPPPVPLLISLRRAASLLDVPSRPLVYPPTSVSSSHQLSPFLLFLPHFRKKIHRFLPPFLPFSTPFPCFWGILLTKRRT